MKQSEWMKGLLWAESVYKKENELNKRDVCDIYIHDNLHRVEDREFINGITDYIKHYEERLKWKS